jgi:invasion protein IalB
MKRLLLLAALLMGAAGLHAQSKATAVVTLTTGMTAKLELNNTTTTATLTLTGPSDRWIALQIGSFTNSGGMQEGADVVYWNGTTLIDGNQNGVGAFPTVDTNDWTSTSTVSGTTRTIVATRAFNTGSSDDFTFVYSDINIDFAWAKASSATNTLNGHGTGNRGYSLNNAYTCVAPPSPTSSAQTFCAVATVANLVATGQAGATFKWYAAATGGTALASTAVLTSTNYFVSQTVGDCESTRTSTAVTVTTVPMPTASEAQSFCSESHVSNLVATGQAGATLNWYNLPTGGDALPGTTLLVAGNYYVSQTVGSCTSARKQVVVSFTTIPTPTASEAQSFCTESHVSDLIATGQAGATLKWYNVPTGGDVLPGTTLLVSGDYYVSQTVGNCVSERKHVVVTVTILPVPTASELQSFCTESHVSNLVATGQAGAVIKWYNVPTGGDVLPGTILLVSGDYYVSQTVGSCTSARRHVVVTVTILPKPTASEIQSFCSESHVSDLVATGQAGATLNWYNVPTGGDILPGTTLLVAGDYYVSQTVGSCTSERRHVVVSFTTLEAPNVPNETAIVCTGATLANLTITGMPGAAFTWYENETGGSAIPASTVVADGADYYVTQTVGNCVSSRRKVIINIDEFPIPVAEHNQSVCAGSEIEDLEAEGVTGAVLTWHKPQTGPALDGDTVLEAGVYYVKQTVNGCTSGVKEVVVALLPAPNPPGGNGTQQFEAGEAVSDLLISVLIGSEIQWYVMEDGELEEIGMDHLLQDGVTYYVTQTVEGCESEPLAITVDEVLGTPTFSLKNLAVYPNPVIDILNISYNEPITEVNVINMLGQVVISQKVNAEKVEVNTSKLQNGSYILKVATTTGTATIKIVK